MAQPSCASPANSALTFVCVAGVQWAEEIEQHLKPGQLKWGRYLPPGSREAAVLSAQPTAKVATPAEAAADSGGTRRSLRVAMAAGSVSRLLASKQ